MNKKLYFISKYSISNIKIYFIILGDLVYWEKKLKRTGLDLILYFFYLNQIKVLMNYRKHHYNPLVTVIPHLKNFNCFLKNFHSIQSILIFT